MKHLNKFLCLAAVLLGFGWASAETVQNYTVDFNTTISTTDHAFKVAPGWKHIVNGSTGYWGDINYVTYTYKADAGISGSGALNIGKQTGSSAENYDFLVTPEITGDVSMQVQLTADVPYGIYIYTINEAEDGTLTVGEKIEAGNELLLTQATYTTVTVSGLQGQRIGIAGNYINLDDFVVTGSAEIEYEKALTVTAATSSITGDGKVYCDTDNNYSFTYTITVQNTGITSSRFAASPSARTNALPTTSPSACERSCSRAYKDSPVETTSSTMRTFFPFRLSSSALSRYNSCIFAVVMDFTYTLTGVCIYNFAPLRATR